MGLPDLPDNGEHETNFSEASGAVIPAADEMEEVAPQVGYQGYSLLDRSDDEEAANDDSSDESDQEYTLDSQPPPINVPSITSSEQEIQKEVWNSPRQIESSNIELDSTKTETILTIMSNFKLSSSIIPPWARDIPEQEWKDDLLQRIRQRHPDSGEGSSSNNQEK